MEHLRYFKKLRKISSSRKTAGDLESILTDFLNKQRKSKLLGGSRGMLPQEIFWILTTQSPLSWASESFRQDIYWLSKPFSRFQLGKFFLIKITGIVNYLWKIWPINFCKTVETGVHCICSPSASCRHYITVVFAFMVLLERENCLWKWLKQRGIINLDIYMNCILLPLLCNKIWMAFFLFLFSQECLNIFGSSKDTGTCTALKMCYAGYGSPLILM